MNTATTSVPVTGIPTAGHNTEGWDTEFSWDNPVPYKLALTIAAVGTNEMRLRLVELPRVDRRVLDELIASGVPAVVAAAEAVLTRRGPATRAEAKRNRKRRLFRR